VTTTTIVTPPATSNSARTMTIAGVVPVDGSDGDEVRAVATVVGAASVPAETVVGSTAAVVDVAASVDAGAVVVATVVGVMTVVGMATVVATVTVVVGFATVVVVAGHAGTASSDCVQEVLAPLGAAVAIARVHARPTRPTNLARIQTARVRFAFAVVIMSEA
jgi:hypothetical protein